MPAPVDPYAFWRAGLAGKPLDAHEGDPQCGFYRKRGKAADDAVAYFYRGDELVCLVNQARLSEAQAIELWTHVCDKPISHKEYLHRLEHGRFPNESPVLVGSTSAPIGPGHNRPPEDNTVEALTSVLDALQAEARRLLAGGAAKTQDEADQAADIANELLAVEHKAVALHKAAKAPLLEATKKLDRTWFGIRDAAQQLKEKIRLQVVTPFLVHQRRLAAAAAAEATQRGEVPGGTKVAAGALKRTTSLRTVVTARIEDYPAALAHFANHPEIRELVQRLADRAARAGVGVPGCARIETEKAV